MASNTPRVRHHASLERVVLFGLELICRSGLHIGAGKSLDLVGSDLPVVRDASGRPLIPGSSLRGVLRAGIEALVAGAGLKPAAPAPGAGDGVPEEFLRAWADMDVVERLFGRVAVGKEDRKGTYASRLTISDLLCQEDVRVELRDGVGISRETRTAAEGVKFDLEVVPAGTRFLGKVRLRNPEDYEVGLVTQALWMLDEGLLLLGGRVARGLGWMEVRVTTPVVCGAQDILEGRIPSLSEDFCPVRDRLGAWLEAVESLVRAAGAGSE